MKLVSAVALCLLSPLAYGQVWWSGAGHDSNNTFRSNLAIPQTCLVHAGVQAFTECESYVLVAGVQNTVVVACQTQNDIAGFDLETAQVLWSKPGAVSQVLGNVASPDGRVFVTTRSSQGESGSIVSLAASTGEVIWNVTNTSTHLYQPALSLDLHRIFAGSSSADVRAYDSRTGDEIWKTSTGNWQVSPDGLVATTANRVFVLLTTGLPSESQLAVLALDARTGRQLWQTSSFRAASGHIAVAADGTVLAFLQVNPLKRGSNTPRTTTQAGFTVYGFNPVTGDRLWSRPLDVFSIAFAVASREVCYVVSFETVVVINTANGQVRANLTLPTACNEYPPESLALSGDDELLTICGAELIVLDAHTGSKKWSGNLGKPTAKGGAVVPAPGNLMLVGTTEGITIFAPNGRPCSP